MRYLVIDASLNGTGIRDKYEGGYIEPADLGLSSEIINQLGDWLSRYAKEHYHGYTNEVKIDELDKEGKAIAMQVKKALIDVKVEYYSDARLSRNIIEDV